MGFSQILQGLLIETSYPSSSNIYNILGPGIVYINALVNIFRSAKVASVLVS